MKFLYLLIDVFSVLIPLLFSFHHKIKFYKEFKYVFVAIAMTGFIFIIWDELFTRLGVWDFNPDYIIGIYVLNLPLEETLFFICIPFSCLFTYYCLDKYYLTAWKPKVENIICIFISLCLLVAGLIFRDKLYTSSTCISAGIICLYIKYIHRVNWFGKAMNVYGFLLIPFIIVNGVLTGTGLSKPVVLYNNSENLGIRFMTIPFEDFVFGFELILLNLFLYQLLKNKY